jgi:hypothetical protein
MRFKIEFLSADGQVCNWVFPKALATLDDAIIWARATPLADGAVTVLVRDAAQTGRIVWRGAAPSGAGNDGALAPIEA